MGIFEKHLPDLPSYKKYTELDNVVISGDDNDYCKKSLESTEKGDKAFCNKIAKNLSILKNEKDMQKRTYDCYYFNHWLYDNIGKKYYDGNTKGKKVKVSEKLLDFVSSANSEYILIPSCNGNPYGNPEGWKKEKDLHDYFENYEKIKCNDSDKSKCEKYVNYVTYINTLFQEKEYNCCDGDELDEEGYSPRDGGTGAVEAGKVPGSGGDEREKKAQVDEVAAVTKGQEPKEKVVSGEVPKEKSADSLAQSAPEKSVLAKPAVQESVGAKPGGLESREEKAEPAKPVAAKPTT
ncbi:PIR protein, partial [Plasmodium vivax]